MQNFVFRILIVSCVIIYLNGEEISAIPNSAKLLKVVAPNNYYCGEGDIDIWRCRDCHSVQYCDGNYWSDMSFNCGNQFPGRPYCNKAAKDINDMCVSDESVCEPDPVQCPGEGIFPSVTNCKAYHLCLSKGEASIPYFCKYDTIYNHASKSCRLNSPCYTVTDECGKQSKVIPYRLDTSLYVVCNGYGYYQQPLLKACPKGLVFDPAMVSCGFKCPGEGAFANPLDSYSYYMCYLDGDVLRKQQIHCPYGTGFDDVKKYCTGIAITTNKQYEYNIRPNKNATRITTHKPIYNTSKGNDE